MVQIDYSKGFINEGNDERILACMAKGLKGEPLTVAFLGGSITQGSLSSTPELCYAYLTYEWWKEQFPKSEITYVNAGIGGTTSHLGTGRVDEEVLSHKPDFVIVEFSVNDADTDVHFEETYEGLVRRILKMRNSRRFFWCTMSVTMTAATQRRCTVPWKNTTRYPASA